MRSKLTPLRKRFAAKMRGLVLNCGSGEGVWNTYLGGDKIVHLDVDIQELKVQVGIRVVGDAAILPFKDNSFDSLWACAVIEHVREDTLPEFERSVRKGGQIAVLTPNKYSPVHLIRRLFGCQGWWRCSGHVRLYSMRELKRFGQVYGEYGRLGKIPQYLPWLGHTLMLYYKKS